MPIEIRELSVKVNITDSKKQEESDSNPNTKINKETIINECMEQVSDFFNSKKER